MTDDTTVSWSDRVDKEYYWDTHFVNKGQLSILLTPNVSKTKERTVFNTQSRSQIRSVKWGSRVTRPVTERGDVAEVVS